MDNARLDVLTSALDASLELVLGVAPDGRVLHANRSALARWADARGAAVRSLFPNEALGELEAAMRAALEEGRSSRFEWGEHGPAGVRAWFACTVTPVAAGGGGVLVSSSDVTALKRSEERLRRSEQMMVDAQGVAQLGTWEWDVSEPHATWSAELYRIYDLKPESYVPSYEAYLTKVHPDDRQRVIDATNGVFNEHVPYSHDERILRPDGSIRYLHTWAFPVLGDDGKLVRLVGVCQDITERKLAEEEVRRLNADLERRVTERTRTIEQSLRDLEAFQAMLSHDLRAPLSIIAGACALIERHRASLPESVVTNVEWIEQTGVRMTRLVEDLLTLAHVGNSRIERARIDLTAACEEVVAQLRRASPSSPCLVTIARGLSCEADPVLVRTVLDNLIGNAWKYSSRVERPHVDIGVTETGAGPTFYVKDNGAGFDMKDAHRLFVPFERLHASDFEGTGVGLAAVHRIIERHGGRIWAESSPGSGASFFFTLGASEAKTTRRAS